jgi:glycosyltransferase involved in cell wall biosynthesis
MKIGIYQEPSSGIGGSEFVAAVMARALRSQGDVEIVHHRPTFGAAELESTFGLDLDGVRFRYVPKPEGDPIYPGGYLATAGRYWRRWNAAVSEPYDLFVANVHGVPPHCRAPRGLLHVLFPTYDRTAKWPWGAPRPGVAGLRDRARKWVFERGWQARLGSYQGRLAISAYTATWVNRYWGTDCRVLYPPVLLDAPPERKGRALVSLSRFTDHKQQADILRAFTRGISPHAPGWELVLVGGLSERSEDVAHLADLRKAAAGFPVRFVVNASRSEIRAELGRATIFCHAMGLGADDTTEPWRVEHFGIATVEAMAAGCVPVVPDCGGQAEIVRHGESGFTCRNADEMAGRVLELIREPAGTSRMAAAARERAREFGVDRFTERFLAEVATLGVASDNPPMQPAVRTRGRPHRVP